MNKENFLKELEDILQREEPCKETDKLAEYDEWDSLAKMSVMAYFSGTFGIKLHASDLKNLLTVSDIISLANEQIQ